MEISCWKDRTKNPNSTFLTGHYTTPENHGRGIFMPSKKRTARSTKGVPAYAILSAC